MLFFFQLPPNIIYYSFLQAPTYPLEANWSSYCFFLHGFRSNFVFFKIMIFWEILKDFSYYCKMQGKPLKNTENTLTLTPRRSSPAYPKISLNPSLKRFSWLLSSPHNVIEPFLTSETQSGHFRW